ncbi:MAG: hypothetical protein IVW51_13670 [Thermaceae bacterium]|nr:hypothetical protein [Thermaceae bacterium]
MNIIAAIIAGLVATLAMTALMYLAPRMGLPKLDIIRMLSTMLSSSRATTTGKVTASGDNVLVGWTVHLMVGAVFGIIYALLWNGFHFRLTWHIGLIFGLLHGIIASWLTPMMLRTVADAPQSQPGIGMTSGMVVGHAIFGLVMALIYVALR